MGKLDKQLVHELGTAHRAFSVFIFNSKGEILLQQRADEKYHSGGFWTTTCGSHPRFGEEIPWAFERRLDEEMSMNCKTDFAFSFIYKTKFEYGLTEQEYDHAYFGVTEHLPFPEKAEVKDWKYTSIENLETDIVLHRENYTECMKICLPQVRNQYEKTFRHKTHE